MWIKHAAMIFMLSEYSIQDNVPIVVKAVLNYWKFCEPKYNFRSHIENKWK